ncbi:tail fiber protein [Vreelandella nanhaiensis]|uniref:Phage tail protein n=1 Tax=Vreelandella nanhaiensis TaxID=1258546 RepID=A0A3S0W3R4_9GAMM|nr:tail fiber protein [Halomonas nanhaiensis]RUR27702.1 hypothetical protein ELY38_18730 [Halomonas nanhaiensis]
MALKITVTNAGRAELINADNTGTGPVEITHIAFTETVFTPSKAMTALPDEIKRVSSIAGEVVAEDTISVTAKDEGPDTYTVRGFGLITEFGTLFAVYGQEEPIIEKSAAATLLLTNDIIFADLPTASLTFGDISFSNPPASLTTPGVVTLSNATDSTAQNQAATPRAVKAANDNANTRLGKNQNLADLTSPATARVNLGLGTSATLGNTALRTSASTTLLLQAAAMNDHRQSGDHDDRYPQRGNNLSDLPSPSQARSNLGLGASATMGTTAQRTSTATNILLQAKAMNDHRQSGDHDERYAAKEHGHAEGDLDLNQLLWGRGSHKLFNNDGSGNAGIAFGADGNIATEPGRPWRIVAQNDSGTGNFTVERADKAVVKGETIRWVVVFELDFSGHAIFKGKINGDGAGLTGTASLRATGTTKADVGLSNVPNLSATDAATANTLMTRNASGDTWARLFRSSFASTNANIAGIYTTQTIGGDYMRPSTPAQVRDAMGAYHQGNLASAFPRSLAVNGYCKLPGGWIQQSGQVIINTGANVANGGTANFATTFPNGISGVALAILSDTPADTDISYKPINNGSMSIFVHSVVTTPNVIVKYIVTGW